MPPSGHIMSPSAPRMPPSAFELCSTGLWRHPGGLWRHNVWPLRGIFSSVPGPGGGYYSNVTTILHQPSTNDCPLKTHEQHFSGPVTATYCFALKNAPENQHFFTSGIKSSCYNNTFWYGRDSNTSVSLSPPLQLSFFSTVGNVGIRIGIVHPAHIAFFDERMRTPSHRCSP